MNVTATAELLPGTTRLNRLPRATYRLQLSAGFGFEDVRQIIDHLERLGISDLYLSPLFRARDDSSHGYDVVDHSRLEPAFGDRTTLNTMAAELRARNMGVLLDLVPNHMGINDPGNSAWADVLENGSASRYSKHFDIHWRVYSDDSRLKVLLPFLGSPFGEALENGELKLLYRKGGFEIAYSDRRFPVCPSTWPPVLEHALEYLPQQEETRSELESVITQLGHLPPESDQGDSARKVRYREQSIARRRLTALAEESAQVLEAIGQSVLAYNGTPGEPASFDRLESLLDSQHYRLAFWRVAADEINYRRFFDINDLVAIRVEEPEVFEQVHKLAFLLLEEQVATGLRIDHPDGLLDPSAYFERLQSSYRKLSISHQDPAPPALYVVAEKILTGDEQLPSEWQVSGTTGYDFLNNVSHLQVDAEGLRQIQAMYAQLTGVGQLARDVVYECKQTILSDVMSSELTVLASLLHDIAKGDRASRDFTQPVLLRAIREIIACFPVYRTYVRPVGWDVRAEDQGRVGSAVRWAKRRNPAMSWSSFDFVASVLLMQFPPHLPDELKVAWREFALRFQQVTGPVTAKGYEDTAFYRYYPLASLNEVGGEVDASGLTIDEFHRLMGRREKEWPASMSSTATHDTKRGEDVRARLNVLTESPNEWAELVEVSNRDTEHLLETVYDELAPSRNVRYLLWQTLVGTWSVAKNDKGDVKQYTDRISNYMVKALREGKLHSSWSNPSEAYEDAVRSFVSRLLADAPGTEVTSRLESFARRIAGAGFVNSLAQVVLKATLPGVPDFYQGSEIWDFRLVDPDNRRPVDHRRSESLLKEIAEEFRANGARLVQNLVRGWDDSLKLFTTWRALSARRRAADVFASGRYAPLRVKGPLADHLVAFVRGEGEAAVAVCVPRHVFGIPTESAGLMPPSDFCGSLWSGTTVYLPWGGSWVNAFTNAPVLAADNNTIDVSQIYEDLPVAILTRAPAVS